MAISRKDRPPPKGCFEKALDLLSRRPHFRRELERKLRMRGFRFEDVESALDRAAERGFLDDTECAREFARVRVERRHEGPAKLFAALSRRGADSETARRAVAEFFSGGEKEHVRRAASLWLDRNDWDHDRLARHLNRKGFSSGSILSTLERLRDGGPYESSMEEEAL